MKSSLWLAVLAALLIGCSTPPQQTHQQPPDAPFKQSVPAIPRGLQPTETHHVNGYTLALYWPENRQPILEITRSGQRVFALQENNIFPGQFNSRPDGKLPLGVNLTGNGNINLVIRTYSGGANCCNDVHVLELGDNFRHIARFDARNAEGVSFEDLDKNGILTVSMTDWHYIDVIAPMIASPAPTIIFRFKDGRYQLASDLMKQPAPAKEELKKFAQEIRQLFEQAQREPGKADEILTRWNPDYPVPQLWSKMLDLIYGGNETEALKLFDEAWLETYPGKEKALRKFNALVDSSPFNPRLRFNPLSKPKP